jgi:hypothetical protein
MDEGRREDERRTTPIIGLLQNLTENTEPRIAILRNLSKHGFLVEAWQKVKLRDAIEFRIQGFTFLGEVVHFGKKGISGWRASELKTNSTTNN